LLTRPDFLLRLHVVGGIQRAIVEVRPWHADRLFASLVEGNPILYDVAGEDSLALGRNFFGTEEFTTVLVISELPASPEPRERTLTALRQRNIGHVIEFPTILFELLEKVHPNVSYSSSVTLQMLRLLKRYDFIRYQQLEFPFPTEAPLASAEASSPVMAQGELDYEGPDYVMELD
jgi:ribosomal protein L30/L7E